MLSEHRMADGHLPATVNVVVAAESVPSQPDNREGRDADGQQKTQAPKRMRTLEVIQVDTLRKSFGF